MTSEESLQFDNPNMMRGAKGTPRISEPDFKIQNSDVTEKEGDRNQKSNKMETQYLRKYLKLYFYSAIKWRGKSVSIHLIYLLMFILHIIKVIVITKQMFEFGNDRANFSSVVNRGHLVLRHLLLLNWDATWETLPYPPSRGDFAVYDIEALETSINFAVERYYNAENEAIGYYVKTKNDTMLIKIKLFDFEGFEGSNKTLSAGLDFRDLEFEVDKGLNSRINPVTNDTIYTYSIMDEFRKRGLYRPFKRMLSLALDFSLHSVRVFELKRHARCLHVHGVVTYIDMENNGQVLGDLETLTSTIKCSELRFSVEDEILSNTSTALGTTVIILCVLSLVSTMAIIVFAVFVLLRTKRYMHQYYRQYYLPNDPNQKDLPTREYLRFVKLWYLISILADCLTLYGTITLVFQIEDSRFILATLDSKTVWLGIGCFLSWVSLLRFFNFHNKFNLLFSTLWRALVDVATYLVCVSVLFVGFWVSGYVVMGPYHVKFKTSEATAETLFSVVNGDELYVTLNILEAKKAGGTWVWWFSRIYMGAYVAIFTVVVINLLIAIFMSAYDSIKEYYAEKREDRDMGPVEKALKQFLAKREQGGNNLRASLHDLMNDQRQLSTEEFTLRAELKKLIRITEGRKDVEVFRPRTLKAFMEDESDEPAEFNCCCITFKFALFSKRR